MPLTWDVDRGPHAVLVSVDGTADPASTAALDAVLDSHTARPGAVVLIDLARLGHRTSDVAAVAAVVAARGLIARAAAVLVQGGGRPTLAPAAGRIGRRTPLVTSLGRATTALLTADRPAVGVRLTPGPGACRLSRDVVTEACLRWDVPDLIGPATLVASELTGHGLDRCGGHAELRVTLHLGVLHVGLRLGGPAATAVHPADAEQLCLVNATAAYWGFLRSGGDTVWCAGLVA